MKTFFKVVYKTTVSVQTVFSCNSWEDEYEDREVNRCEFHETREEANKRSLQFGEKFIGVFKCEFEEEFVERCKYWAKRRMNTGEFGFSYRKSLKNEAFKELLPARMTKENKREYMNKKDYIHACV